MADGKKKTKAKAMNLQELNAAPGLGSWADSLPENLPTAPSSEPGRGRSTFGEDFRGSGPGDKGSYRNWDDRGSGGDRGFRDRGDRQPRQSMSNNSTQWRTQRSQDRSERPEPRQPTPSDWRNAPRGHASSVFGDREPPASTFKSSQPPRSEQLSFPTQPPFTAYVSNLGPKCDQEALLNFFQGLSVKEIKLPTHYDGSVKGFAYVEFEDLFSLENSMNAEGHACAGVPIRIGVARGEAAKPHSSTNNAPSTGWRSAARPVSGPPPPREQRGSGQASSLSPLEKEPPKERQRLQLKPRSQVAPTAIDGSPITPVISDAYEKSTKSNPFGGAKAVDTLEAERKIEENRRKREEESRKHKEAEEAAKKEAEEVAKKEAEEAAKKEAEDAAKPGVVEGAKKMSEEGVKSKTEEKQVKENHQERQEGGSGRSHYSTDNVSSSNWRSGARPASGPPPQSRQKRSQSAANTFPPLAKEPSKENQNSRIKTKLQESSTAVRPYEKSNSFAGAKDSDTIDTEKKIEYNRNSRFDGRRKKNKAEEAAKKAEEEEMAKSGAKDINLYSSLECEVAI